MSILTTISGIPLYSTRQEALAWGAENRLSGYHIHKFQGQTGYMGGTSHSNATGISSGSNTGNKSSTGGTSGSSSGSSSGYSSGSSGGSSSGGGGY
tara:strand:+ start:1679 stop:1966 length:288 start_codon:yes stop_codon:yes gene_type:complete